MKICSVKLSTVLITAGVILLVVFGIFCTACSLSDAVSGEARMLPVYNVKTDENKVALTFNCAQSGDIDELLTVLEAYDVKCTFFLLGSWAEKHPPEVKAIYDAGHEIGNHGYSHKDLPSMSFESILLDIQQCNNAIKSITGHTPTLLRAPSGAYDNKTISAAESLGMMTIQWDVDSLDWKNISASEILTRVKDKVQKGSVIQLHTGTDHTSEALPMILDYLKAQNLTPVTVSELIYFTDYTINHNGTQIKVSTT